MLSEGFTQNGNRLLQPDSTLTSTPNGADIAIDGKFVGNTLSTLSVTTGDHEVSIGMQGYQPWNRTIYHI
jgi:PEGA domain